MKGKRLTCGSKPWIASCCDVNNFFLAKFTALIGDATYMSFPNQSMQKQMYAKVINAALSRGASRWLLLCL